MTIRQLYSDPFSNQWFGVITGTFGITQLPNIPGRMFRLRASSGNTGNFQQGLTLIGSHQIT